MEENELTLRKLEWSMLRHVYGEHLSKSFPPAERKPLTAMEKLMKAGRYEGHGLYRGGELLAYACLWNDPEGDYVLLDYLALCQGQPHGQGLGAAALRLVCDYCRHKRGILVEAEAEDSRAAPGERAIRARRLAFYRRAGFRDLSYVARIFGVRYAMLFSGEGTDEEAMEAHERLYHFEFNPWMYRRFIEIPER